MENTRAPIYWEYRIVESGTVMEEEWKLVGVYGGLVFSWMVFKRHVPEDQVAS